MTRIAAGLKRSGLAQIATDPKDKRRIQIRATPKGTRLLQAGRRRRIEYLAQQLGGLGEAELSTLAEATEILEAVLRRWK
jgi:DNA-binding MarR family transcriptional regulator